MADRSYVEELLTPGFMPATDREEQDQMLAEQAFALAFRRRREAQDDLFAALSPGKERGMTQVDPATGAAQAGLREDLCERCGGKAWVAKSKLSDAPPIRVGPCGGCNRDGAIPPPVPFIDPGATPKGRAA